MALPSSSRLSMPCVSGSCLRPPSMEVGRRSARRNPAAPTSTAPPITNASDGSQAPARSRKPMILDGSVIPDTISPAPKSRPMRNEVSAAMSSSSQHVAHDEHGDDPRAHERGRRRERAWRQPRDPADAVAAGAARAVASPDADERSRQQYHREAGFDGRGRKSREPPVESRRREQSHHEGNPPTDVPARRTQQPAEYAADARDAPVDQHERCNGGADHQAAGQRAPGSEMRPVDCHELSAVSCQPSVGKPVSQGTVNWRLAAYP